MSSGPELPPDGENRRAQDPARYPNLGTKGLSVSSAEGADISIPGSPLEGWLVATGLLLAGCLAMGIYLVVLHH